MPTDQTSLLMRGEVLQTHVGAAGKLIEVIERVQEDGLTGYVKTTREAAHGSREGYIILLDGEPRAAIFDLAGAHHFEKEALHLMGGDSTDPACTLEVHAGVDVGFILEFFLEGNLSVTVRAQLTNHLRKGDLSPARVVRRGPLLKVPTQETPPPRVTIELSIADLDLEELRGRHPLSPRHGLERFQVVPTNHGTYARALALALGQERGLFVLTGTSGCGKTHLLQAMAELADERGSVYLNMNELADFVMDFETELAATLKRHVRLLLLDDGDDFARVGDHLKSGLTSLIRKALATRTDVVIAARELRSFEDGPLSEMVDSAKRLELTAPDATLARKIIEQEIEELTRGAEEGVADLLLQTGTESLADLLGLFDRAAGVAEEVGSPLTNEIMEITLEETGFQVEIQSEDTLVPLNQGLTFTTLAIGMSNQELVANLRRYAERGRPPLPIIISGPAGEGKTHLIHALAKHLVDMLPGQNVGLIGPQFYRQLILTSPERGRDLVGELTGVRILICDDMDLFPLDLLPQLEKVVNVLGEHGGKVVMTVTSTPDDHRALNRLKERFAEHRVFDIRQPDFRLRSEILLRAAQKRELPLTRERASLVAKILTRTTQLVTFADWMATRFGPQELVHDFILGDTLKEFKSNQESLRSRFLTSIKNDRDFRFGEGVLALLDRRCATLRRLRFMVDLLYRSTSENEAEISQGEAEALLTAVGL